MGQQQLLLIILGVIIVGIAIAVGLSMFSAQSISSNKDAIIMDITHLGSVAYQFAIKPLNQGGGGGSYTGWTIPTTLASNSNGTYTLVGTPGATVTILGASAQPGKSANTCQVTFAATGVVSGAWTFAGEFI